MVNVDHFWKLPIWQGSWFPKTEKFRANSISLIDLNQTGLRARFEDIKAQLSLHPSSAQRTMFALRASASVLSAT
jgi:hypothetical protein